MRALNRRLVWCLTVAVSVGLLCAGDVTAAELESLTWPPVLPGGEGYVSVTSAEFLQPHESRLPDVAIAKEAPTVELLYYPEQNYLGRPWSVWGDGSAVGDVYYSAIGDHGAPAGNAFVCEYNSKTHRLRTLARTTDVLGKPDGHYRPGKIHSRVDQGSDGWLYYSTHRGSTRVTNDENHYIGDWILRTNPESGETQVVKHAPVEKCCLPTSVLDPERLIYYGGTAAGDFRDRTVMFYAWDVRKQKRLQLAENGPTRCLILAKSTGRVYWLDEVNDRLMRYDPATNAPPQVVTAAGGFGLRAATEETPEGWVYTIGREDGSLWRFNTKTEAVEELGTSLVGTQVYTASLDADPTGRFLYYVPGAHGGSEKDGSPVVQYDTKTRTRKVIAYLAPVLQAKYGFTPLGTYGSAVSPDGATLYITWNGNRSGTDRRGRLPFDTCGLTVIHIPESERAAE